jgi:hypothetical protein
MLSVADCLEIIKERAQKNSGDKWLAELAKRYVAILQQQGDEKATYANRKRTVYRAFEEKSCSAETLFNLIEAVDCKLQIACTEVKILQ